jgi:hypothetical protein
MHGIARSSACKAFVAELVGMRRGNGACINNNLFWQSPSAARAYAFGDGYSDTSMTYGGGSIAGSVSMSQ